MASLTTQLYSYGLTKIKNKEEINGFIEKKKISELKYLNNLIQQQIDDSHFQSAKLKKSTSTEPTKNIYQQRSNQLKIIETNGIVKQLRLINETESTEVKPIQR